MTRNQLIDRSRNMSRAVMLERAKLRAKIHNAASHLADARRDDLPRLEMIVTQLAQYWEAYDRLLLTGVAEAEPVPPEGWTFID